MGNLETGTKNTCLEKTVCNICESDDTCAYVQSSGLDVWICNECGTAFTHPQPIDLGTQYDSSYFELYARRRVFRLKRACKRLRKIELLMPPGRLLDVGCSLGYFVEAANARGWDGYGMEISDYAAKVAADNGLKVKPGNLEDACYPDGFFDCVTMWDVLEHVPDPTAHMLEVKRILKPGGLVVVGTPNFSHPIAKRKMKDGSTGWRHFKPQEHVFYFTPPSLRKLYAKCGFQTVCPPLLPGNAGLITAALSEAFCRVMQLNDVMILYGRVDDK